MKYPLSVFVVSSLSIVLNLAHMDAAMADSVQLSHAGSKSLSSGLSTASSGALTVVSGVLSVPLQIVDGIAAESEASANRCNTCTNGFPIADEIITFDSPGDAVE